MRVQIYYTVDPAYLDTIKVSASKFMPSFQPSLRMEACARGLGFNTWAAMKATSLSRRVLEVEDAANFGLSRGVACAPLNFHLTMADATLHRIALMNPELHWHGMHAGYFSPSAEEARVIKESHSVGEYFKQVQKVRVSKFDESRLQLLQSNQPDQVLRAMALFASLVPTKAVGPKARSSYGMKHTAERLTFDLGGGVILPPAYVSNVDAIIAALDGGFPIKHLHDSSPNVSIGIAVASLRAADANSESRSRFA